MKNIILLFLLINSINCIYGNDTIILEKRDIFIYQGFGFQYSDEEAENMNLFLLNHGNPINIEFEIVDNIWDDILDTNIILEYENIIVNYFRWNVRGTNEYSELLISIISKENIEYLYGIKHGMEIIEIENIIGKINFIGDNAYTFLRNQTIHGTQIWFFENKIEKIIWYYSIQ